MVALLAAAAAIFWVRQPISDLISSTRDAFDGVQGSVDEARRLIEDAQEAADQPVGGGATEGYTNIRAVVTDLRKGGLPCGATKVDTAEGPVATGSCQARGAHVQINLYLTESTLAFAETEFYTDDWPFNFVHKDNWFISSTLPVTREIHRILGGKFHRADDG